MLLDSRLNFNEHVQSKMNKCYKIIGLINKLSIHLPREALLRIYKSFTRPNLEYGDIVSKVELKVFNIKRIAITGAIQ